MKPGRLGFLGEGYPASLLSMPVASSVATGTALRAAIRSLPAREGAPLRRPFPNALYPTARPSCKSRRAWPFHMEQDAIYGGYTI